MILTLVPAAFIFILSKGAFSDLSRVITFGVEGVFLLFVLIINRSRFAGGFVAFKNKKATRDTLVSLGVLIGILNLKFAMAAAVLAIVSISECIENRIIGETYTSRDPITKSAEKAALMLVPISIAVAVITYFLWFFGSHDLVRAADACMAVLFIASPCAFNYAAPITLKIGLEKSAEKGVLIKSAAVLEDAHSIDMVVLDKTGTITVGNPQITDIIAMSDDFDLRLAAGIEKHSVHPLAEAIVSAALERSGEIAEPETYEEIPGRGAVARLRGKEYIAGNATFLESKGIEVDSEEGEELSRRGKTVVYFARDEEIIGIIALRDGPKPTSLRAVSRIENMGIDVIMLTGDNRETAEAIKKEVGIDRAISQILPQDKDKVIANLQADTQKVVAMVGDGISDAPAIRQADVGFAIGVDDGALPESADIGIMSDDLNAIGGTIELSKKVTSKIKENLIGVTVYNVAGILVAAGSLYMLTGWAPNPILCSIFMCLSSIGIAINSMRLR
ncbi:MAG: heavy metal translocating P-type ATPase [Bacillota bacterium]|nr:heavy metal translocating P-type ATPase [Bacillota bacterium]